MGKDSKIEWTDHTFNPWIGCTKVSPGCTNCYAEALMDRRMKKVRWGKGNPRSRTTPGNWRKPIAWNEEAATGADLWDQRGPDDAPAPRPRVFCASLSDWLDAEIPTVWVADLLVLIASTPCLDWLLLTKRPELWRARMEEVAEPFVAGDPNAHPGAEIAYDWAANGIAPKNVWLGTTVEDQQRALERVPVLLEIPARVRFLSCEPLLGEVNLRLWLPDGKIHWVIAGGESGANARPMNEAWARDLRDQANESGVAFLFKQWGAWVSQAQAPEDAIELTGTQEHTDQLRVGKKRAGRLLDGRTWTEFPRSVTA